MIKITDLCFSFPSRMNEPKKVFDHFSLTLKKGRITSIIGHSGCGKTTLINLLAGYLKPTSGKIEKNGVLISSPARDRFVINQENDLFDWMTVFENVNFCSDGKKSVSDCIELVGLSDFQSNYPNELSGGMKKRVSFARALVVNPDCLIMDEPFSSIDHKKRVVLYEELLRFIKKEDKTILLVTHDIDEALALSDEVVLIGGQPTGVKGILEIKNKTPSNLMSLKKQIKRIFLKD